MRPNFEIIITELSDSEAKEHGNAVKVSIFDKANNQVIDSAAVRSIHHAFVLAGSYIQKYA